MTGDEKKRAALDFGENLKTPPAPPVDPDAVKAAAHAEGFRETPKSPAPASARSKQTRRRTRRKTGRTEQFATRLRPDTLDAIYDYADRHEITLAETIERSVSALAASESNGDQIRS